MIKFCSSILFVKDINVSRQFYEGLLKQKVEIDYNINIAYESGFSLWQTKTAYENIYGNLVNNENEKQEASKFELYFETDEIEELYTKLQHSKVKILNEMNEQPWGQRVFRVLDPDGYIVEFGELMSTVIKRFYKSGMTAEDVAKRAYTPLGIVLKEIENE